LNKLLDIQLGKDGPTVSRLGLGCYPLGGHGWGAWDQEEAVAAVKIAVDSGVTLFDTADVYGLGRSETLLREALGPRLQDVVVASKGGVAWDDRGRTRRDSSPAYLRTAVEGSLRRLGLERIGLYYLHWKDEVTPLADSVAELVRMQEEGKIEFVGLSNVSSEDVMLSCKTRRIHAVQTRANILHSEGVEELAQACREVESTLVFWGALNDGLLTGKYNRNSRFGADDHRSRADDFQGERFAANLVIVDSLRDIATKYDASLAQLALRWLLDRFEKSVVLFGARNAGQVADSVKASCWTLSADDCARIDELSHGRR
jgi:myo-inositol catabolism protein IolS